MCETNHFKIGYEHVWICDTSMSHENKLQPLFIAQVPHLGPLVVNRCAGKAPCAEVPREPQPRHRLPGDMAMDACVATLVVI